jgi:magnesium chelatase family protein
MGDSLFLGELSLDGSLRHTNGILSMLALAAEKQVTTVYVFSADAVEAALIQGITLYPVETLGQLVAHLNGDRLIEPYVPGPRVLILPIKYLMNKIWRQCVDRSMSSGH